MDNNGRLPAISRYNAGMTTVRLEVRLTPEEMAEVKAMAESDCRSVSAWARLAILSACRQSVHVISEATLSAEEMNRPTVIVPPERFKAKKQLCARCARIGIASCDACRKRASEPEPAA